MDLKSNSLPINIFEQKWLKIPACKKNNYAFGGLYFDASYGIKSFKIGIFNQEHINININDGFIKTWFYSNNSFDTLLNTSNIGKDLDEISIKGTLKYYKTNGLFIQKHLLIFPKHSIKIKAKIFNARNIQLLNVDGYNNKKKFKLNFDYYYSNKNYISKNKDHDSSYSALGYGFDLEYNFHNNKFDVYIGVLNINSFLYWRGITYMHYEFDSQTTYVGDDGYSHLKPFGKGSYKQNINYKQKLPTYYNLSLNYKLDDLNILGLNTNIYKNNSFNEVYFKKYIHKIGYKVGYIYQGDNLTFGLNYKNLTLGISHNFSTSKNILQAKCKISF